MWIEVGARDLHSLAVHEICGGLHEELCILVVDAVVTTARTVVGGLQRTGSADQNHATEQGEHQADNQG